MNIMKHGFSQIEYFHCYNNCCYPVCLKLHGHIIKWRHIKKKNLLIFIKYSYMHTYVRNGVRQRQILARLGDTWRTSDKFGDIKSLNKWSQVGDKLWVICGNSNSNSVLMKAGNLLQPGSTYLSFVFLETF